MTTNKEWEMICKEWCKQNKATLLFVNDDNFGCELPNGRLAHIYASELYELLRKENE